MDPQVGLKPSLASSEVTRTATTWPVAEQKRRELVITATYHQTGHVGCAGEGVKETQTQHHSRNPSNYYVLSET